MVRKLRHSQIHYPLWMPELKMDRLAFGITKNALERDQKQKRQKEKLLSDDYFADFC